MTERISKGFSEIPNNHLRAVFVILAYFSYGSANLDNLNMNSPPNLNDFTKVAHIIYRPNTSQNEEEEEGNLYRVIISVSSIKIAKEVIERYPTLFYNYFKPDNVESFIQYVDSILSQLVLQEDARFDEEETLDGNKIRFYSLSDKHIDNKINKLIELGWSKISFN